MPISIDQPKSIRDSTHAMRIAMPTIPIHRPEDENEDHDMTSEAFALAGVSIAATFVATGGDPWAMTIPGAIFASFIALLKTTQDKRSFAEKSANSIGISFIGSTAPAGILQYIWPEITTKLNWQLAALLGFAFGLCGWPLAYAFVKVFGLRSERFANQTVKQFERRYLPEDQDSKDGRGEP